LIEAATEFYGVHADKASLIKLRLDARLLKLDLSQGVRSILSGQHSSRFRGRGMDYSESRQYQPGDDVRNIDWRVTARTGKTHTKVYIEERERPVFIMVDFSPSMYFGTRETYKSVLAAQAAALLAWTTVQHGDRVGGVLMANSQVIDLKPKAGRRGALSIINALANATREEINYNHPPQLNRALEHLSAVVHPGSLVFLFSDFYQIDDVTRKFLSRIRQHNDVVACHLLDPIEITPPQAGQYAITDGSSQGKIAVINTASLTSREKYRKYFLDHEESLMQLSSSLGIPVFNLVNGENLVQVMSRVFGR
jgi:uncharacterized protein (DUF58 family)